MPNPAQQYKRITTEDIISPNLDVSPELSQRAYLNILEDMQTEKEEMEEQRIATFNIMEDITEAQEELKKRFSELDTLKDLVQKLGSSLKTTTVLGQLIQALRQTLPASANFAYIIPSADPGKPSNLMYIHAATPLSSRYINVVKDNMALSFDLLPTKLQRREELARWIRGKFLFEFIEGTMDGNETASPLSIFNIPFVVRDEILGIVNISSPEPNLFNEKEINLANTMANATASTISRLRQLLDSEQSRVQSLMQSLTNGVVMFDQDQRVTMSNPVAQRLTGLPSEGFYLSELIKLFTSAAAAADKDVLSVFDAKITQTLQTGEVTHIEEVKVSRFSYEVFVNPVRDYEKNIIGGAIIFHDITHIKEIDRMKTEFVSIASHQLRTPLTAIKLFGEMLLNEEVGKLLPKQRDYVKDMYESTERMVRLVNDLLNVSRLETGRLKVEPVPTQLEEMVESIIKEESAVAKAHNCAVEFKHPKQLLPKMPLDQTLMRQVIHNLFTNAVKYSQPGQSEVAVEIAATKANAEALKLVQEKVAGSTAANLPPYILVSVTDNGIGVPKEAQARMFEKFFRADNALKTQAEGSGLGLYVSKMIIEAMNGKIWYISGEDKNKGSTFYVAFPESGMLAKEGEKSLA